MKEKPGLSVVGTRLVLRVVRVAIFLARVAAADLRRLASVPLVAANRRMRRVALGAVRELFAFAIYFNDVAVVVEEQTAFAAVHLAFEAAATGAIGRACAEMVAAVGGIFMLIVLCAHRVGRARACGCGAGGRTRRQKRMSMSRATEMNCSIMLDLSASKFQVDSRCAAEALNEIEMERLRVVAAGTTQYRFLKIASRPL